MKSKVKSKDKKSTITKTPKVKDDSVKTYVVDKTRLTQQLLTDDVSNWIIEAGAKMFLEGKTPGKNMIYFLEYMKIIRSI